jgi:N-acetylmuramoyl-L-alanine amidase
MRLKRSIFLFTILLFISSEFAFSQGYKVKTIVIDAGHGGGKPGAAGSNSV